MRLAVYQWLNDAQRLAYPSRCLLCDAPGVAGRDLCAGCADDLPWQSLGCARCALTLPPASATGAQPPLCPQCRRRAPPFSAAWTPLRYAWPVDWLITQLKFHARLTHARLFGELMHQHVQQRQSSLSRAPFPQALIPVPLHPRRWRERGFNQAAEIAGPLGRALGVAVRHDLVRRTRDTAHQADLPARQRAGNVRAAFAAPPVRGIDHVAIVDDVVTTGATAAALARTLRDAGVANVELWCAARA